MKFTSAQAWFAVISTGPGCLCVELCSVVASSLRTAHQRLLFSLWHSPAVTYCSFTAVFNLVFRVF